MWNGSICPESSGSGGTSGVSGGVCRSTITTLAAVAVAALLLCGAGCDHGPKPVRSEAMGDVWTPLPVSVRVYPSTRFVKQEGQPLLQARIELFDQMGDSVKASGRVRCVLMAGVGRLASGELYSWDVPLLTLQDHEAHYDPIARGYLFELKLDNFDPAFRRCSLVVQFRTADGRLLEDRAELGSMVEPQV